MHLIYSINAIQYLDYLYSWCDLPSYISLLMGGEDAHRPPGGPWLFPASLSAGEQLRPIAPRNRAQTLRFVAT